MLCLAYIGLLLSYTTLSLASSIKCSKLDLVVYRVVFQTNWSREHFPKQYPEWRPPAQWSRVVGLSHNVHYRLYQLGDLASPELKLFAETGKQEILGNENQTQVLHQFLLPAIKNGSGSVSSNMFVDGNHSKVSLVAKIVPSPDWFVGIDSLDLCEDGHWVDTVTVEASPIDAGTDNGFTFTAPNWETDPQEPIYKITAQYPRHPANSFYYPHLQDLPPIATFFLRKLKVFHPANERSYEQLPPLITTPTTSTTTTTPAPSSTADDAENMIFVGPSPKSVNETEEIRKHNKRKVRNKAKGSVTKCKVGKWSKWTACNGPCGQSMRKRSVIWPSADCPPLLQKRTCGCTKYIFNWKK